MKLSNWAKKTGISYLTAWRWWKTGKLPVKVYQTPSGTLIVEEELSSAKNAEKIYIYARVSSYDQKDDLERQIQRCIDYCASKGWQVESVIKEIASGLNDHRPKLRQLLKSKPSKIVIEHKERLTRFGFEYFETLLPMLGCEIHIINKSESKYELTEDLIAIVTSFCARLYGSRSHKQKKIVEEISA